MTDTNSTQLRAYYLARAAEFRELSRTETEPVLAIAYAQLAQNFEALAKWAREEDS
jgi:hypothetical protein